MTTVIEVPTPAFPLTDLQSIVLSIFWLHGDQTDSELDALYGAVWEHKGWPQVHPETPRRRRSQLKNLGLLKDAGIKRVNKFGSTERVWTLA